jgi:hypothetical protein
MPEIPELEFLENTVRQMHERIDALLASLQRDVKYEFIDAFFALCHNFDEPECSADAPDVKI